MFPSWTSPGSNAMVEVVAYPIHSPTIKYQPRKANIVADTVSRTQQKLDEGSTNDSIATTAAAIEKHVSALSGVSIELTAEDLQKWTTAYKEDKGHVATYMKLR